MDPFTVKIKNPENNEENTITIGEYIPQVGPGKGNMKLRPIDLEDWDADKFIKLYGKKKLWDTLWSKVTQTFANFTEEATTRRFVGKDGKEVEEPETDVAVIIKDFSEMVQVWSRRGESQQALSRRLGELSADRARIADILITQTDAKGPVSPADMAKYKTQYANIKTECIDLEKAIASIKASKKKDEGDDEPKAPQVELKKAA
jgi:hypothetical protein